MNSILLHIPHSSDFIPKKYKSIFLDSVDLKSEIRKMTDWYTDDLFFGALDRIICPVSRLVCDVERFRDRTLEEMANKGMWICYERTSMGLPLATFSLEHERDILMHYYDEHHMLLNEKVEELLKQHEYVILVDCHSFSSIPLSHEDDKAMPRPDICIGTDSFHTPRALTCFTKHYFNDNGLSVKENSPFNGTIVPTKYYHINPHVISIMIEINRGVYMDEDTINKSKNYEKIKGIIYEYIRNLENTPMYKFL